MNELANTLLLLLLGTVLWGIPVLLTVFHVVLLFLDHYEGRIRKWRTIAEIAVFLLGSLYSMGYAAITNICLSADWNVQLYNGQVHTPVATWTRPTVLAFVCVGIAGYLILRLVPLRRMPPLVVVTGISCTYAGILISILWCVQICKGEFVWLMLFPINCILLDLIQIKSLIIQWQNLKQKEKRRFQNPLLQKCNDRLDNACTWPAWAFVLLLPILGLLIGVLVLLGQQPDDVIQAFTQTSDWNLSNRVSPQNIYYDEHYLCTVAAGGHPGVVKPLRMGVRHGHPVIVNRQLCIANAFEQVLEERVPRFHRIIRHIYDTCGYPVAKLIHSPYTADMIYFIMKPLEWLFLLVLYFCDVNPENRIAIQYLPLEKFRCTKRAGFDKIESEQSD